MMRYQKDRRRAGVLALALAVCVTVGAAEAGTAQPSMGLEGAAATPVPTEAAASTSVELSYEGVELQVPASWSVVDLASSPTTCVRFDVNAVYLGTPGPTQDCPASVLGRTNAILLQPLPSELPFGTVTLTPGAVPDPTGQQLTAGEVVARIAGTQVLVTASLGSDVEPVTQILRSIAVVAPTDPLAGAGDGLTVAALANPVPLDRSFTWHYGRGFDACTAPALSTMQAWLASPFRAIGIYIGGAARACSQANLTPSWLRAIATMGWKAQPIYVGLQAPCTPFTNRITYGQEWTQGRDAALDAVARARALGIGAGSDIYYDMEWYPRSTQCSGSVRAFLSSWTSTLQYNGYSSGVYSSASAAIIDLASGGGQPGFVPPNKIWIARWNVAPNVYGHTAYVADSQWAPYRRMHQYLGGHVETHGGVSINIDSNLLDTDANRGNPIGQFETVTGGPGTVTAQGWALDPDTSGPVIVQMYLDGASNSAVWANQARPDVGTAFPAAGPDHGYSITMNATPGRHTACLYAINTGPGWSKSLGCRTVTVLTSNPFGQVESATGGRGTLTARGWAIDPNASGPIMVQMYIDGAANAITWANQPRADVGAVFPAAGPNHGYSITMNATPGRHTACLYAINTGPGASTRLGCRTVNVLNSNPFGQVDLVTAGPGTVTARGWAIDPDTSGPIIVQMYLDGVSNSMVWANQARPDVGTAFPASGPNHGYTITMPASPGRHTLCLYAINTGPGASTGLGCRTVTAP